MFVGQVEENLMSYLGQTLAPNMVKKKKKKKKKERKRKEKKEHLLKFVESSLGKGRSGSGKRWVMNRVEIWKQAHNWQKAN